MSVSFNWTCPTCGAHTVITEPNYNTGVTRIRCSSTADGQHIQLQHWLIECPNGSCKSQNFRVAVNHGQIRKNQFGEVSGFLPNGPVGIENFTFLPTTSKPLSQHVPPHVSEDYCEAYLIKSLSPKASATLARRALQGMIRDFFGVQGKKTLHHELQAVEDQCDPELYAAMMAVKSVGNIGAHPEKDVSLMIDVEPEEAEVLLNLIHLLDQEWYVARAGRTDRIAKMQALGVAKKQDQKPGQPVSQS